MIKLNRNVFQEFIKKEASQELIISRTLGKKKSLI
jgi:hypothetical protein